MRYSFCLLVLVSGCATLTPMEETRPEVLLREACELGSEIEAIEGSAWLDAHSKEASGQFPAQIRVTKGTLDVEVTNLLGGTEAFIKIRGDEIELNLPGKARQVKKGTWGGIPLRWAAVLFLGKIPCPSSTALRDAVPHVDGDHHLHLDLKRSHETFEYSFRNFAARPWPEGVHWKKKTPKGEYEVQFEFDQPDSKTRLPQAWTAKSSAGEVRFRWKRREVTEKGEKQGG